MTVTPAAVERAKALIDSRGKQTAGIRIGVRTKGCSGLSYTLEFADKQEPMDEVVETEGLKANKFILAFQPVASLTGEPTDLHDVLVRMRGDKDEEIPPKDFLPAAERIGMMTAIDRWILENSVKMIAERAKQGHKSSLFVRLSDQSLTDKNLSLIHISEPTRP